MSFELKDFERDVLERSRQVPVLVDFWAPWCGPCRTLGPVLESMADRAGGRWELVKINTEECQDLAAAFDITSIPAVKLFVDGQVVDGFVGALPEREISRFLEKALPSPHTAQLAEAERLLSEGSYSKATELLEPLVASDTANSRARVLLAQSLLSSAPERIEPLLAVVPIDSEEADRANALRTLARIARLPGQGEALPEARVRDRYLEGAAAVRAGDFAAALPAFIEVLERDKTYDNAGAKEACKSIFQLLGFRHPLAGRFSRAFSSALHS